MSRRNKRRPQGKPTVVTQERPQEQRRTPALRPGATNFRPVSDSIIASMYHNMGPQANVDAMYAPGAPLRPMPGLVPKEGLRVFDYQVGHNIGRLPRSTEVYSFVDLRALSQMYYGIQMCQQVWFDYISQLELDIQPCKDLIGEDGDISMFEADIENYKEFFASPDKDHDLHSWLQMAVKDQLEIDAVAIYPRKDRAGRLYSLDLIDAAMITPLVDDRGRKPLPPYPAYEQYVHGIPAALLTSEDLIYIKETERTDSVYGRSRVEKIILNINIALRKQTKDLAHFTDGNLPPGFVQPSMDVQWSQEEIEAWEMQLNNVLAGNDELRARLKVLPRGFEYQAVTGSDDIHTELDQLILNITAACHGLTMAELAFVADVNRANGESQENVVYRRAMGPLMKRYARLFTMILHKYFKDKRFVVSFKGYEETEDLQANATAYSMLTGAGILGISEAAKLMKLPEDPDAPKIGRMIITKDGPMFLDDMASEEVRDAQLKAKLAGLDVAANPQPPVSAGETQTKPGSLPQKKSDEEEESPAMKRLMAQVEAILRKLDRVEVVRSESQSLPVVDISQIDQRLADLRAQGVHSLTWQSNCECDICQQNNGQTRALNETFPSGHVLPPCHEGCDCGAEYHKEPPTARDVVLELNKWRSCAVHDLKAERKIREFVSNILPSDLHKSIASELEACRTVDDVRVIFERAKDRQEVEVV